MLILLDLIDLLPKAISIPLSVCPDLLRMRPLGLPSPSGDPDFLSHLVVADKKHRQLSISPGKRYLHLSGGRGAPACGKRKMPRSDSSFIPGLGGGMCGLPLQSPMLPAEGGERAEGGACGKGPGGPRLPGQNGNRRGGASLLARCSPMPGSRAGSPAPVSVARRD